MAKLFEHKSIPHICFYARKEINVGEQITFNYDGTKCETFTWRKKREKSDR